MILIILVRRILRKFDMNVVHFCPPHLSSVATLPWEIQKKVIFSSIIRTYFRLFTLSRKIQIATVVLQLSCLLTVV